MRTMHVSLILKKHKIHSLNIFMKSLVEKLFTWDMCPFKCEHIYYNASTRDSNLV